jgi:hypothetical protein
MKLSEKLAIAFYICVAAGSMWMIPKVVKMEPRLPCSVAEISPDFSSANRAWCRAMRNHKM